MHYNPRSCEKAAEVTRRLRESGELGAVVLETCPTRWDALTFDQPRGSAQRALLDNEFQAAAEEAEDAGAPVIFGDQAVEELGQDVSALVKEIATDLVSPFDGGWQRTGADLSKGLNMLTSSPRAGQPKASREQAAPAANDVIDLPDFADIGFILGLPVAVGRYALTWLIKSPRLFATAVAALCVLKVLLSEPPDELPGSSPVADFFFVLIEVFTWRLLIGVLLEDRDNILAKSISDACEKSGGRGKAVVAVLGAAHCNAVKRIILDPPGEGEAEEEPGAKSETVAAVAG